MQNKENCSREIWNNEQNLTQLEINKMLIVDFFSVRKAIIWLHTKFNMYDTVLYCI